MLQAIALTRQFGQHTALHALSLAVGKGEIFCLLGPNGAGKTTTINCFLGFLSPSSGTPLVNGIDVAQRRQEARRHIAYIPETVMLYPYLSGLENLQFFHALSGREFPKEHYIRLLLESGLQEDAIHRRVKKHYQN